MIKRFIYIFFLLLLIILVFNTFTNGNNVTTLSFLDYLQRCPDTLSLLSKDLKVFFEYKPDPNGFADMLGLSTLLSVLSKIIGFLGYIGSCIVYLITILIYVFNFIFI